MSFQLPTVYPITDVSIAKLSHLEQVEKLIAGGAVLIQLRDKYAAPKDFYAAAKEVSKYARARGAKIIINDRVDIALTAGADGVHLGQDDLPPEQARKILGEKAIIGFSTHSLKQAVEASKFPIDYIAIGPVFHTSTKENPDADVGIEGVKDVRDKLGDFPLVAIGGINQKNAVDVWHSGADSIAVIGSILNSTNISDTYRNLAQLHC